ncbi:MAG: hypothetical protein HY402_03745 [Elusimicrobia bacterium]|nr:hypothetical protein [Elusimicrobiota bacterium]
MPRRFKLKPGKKPRLDQELCGPLLRKHPSLQEVLEEHGVHFCAGCYITLFSPLKKAAAYHAVPDYEQLLRDLGSALRCRPRVRR